jgi:hypothetical protein
LPVPSSRPRDLQGLFGWAIAAVSVWYEGVGWDLISAFDRGQRQSSAAAVGALHCRNALSAL